MFYCRTRSIVACAHSVYTLYLVYREWFIIKKQKCRPSAARDSLNVAYFLIIIFLSSEIYNEIYYTKRTYNKAALIEKLNLELQSGAS